MRSPADRLLADYASQWRGGIAQLFTLQAEAVERGGPAAPPAPSGKR